MIQNKLYHGSIFSQANISLKNGILHQIIYVNQECVWQGIYKLKWITFDQFFESLKVCFIVLFWRLKIAKLKTCKNVYLFSKKMAHDLVIPHKL
jgi:hypothetical protein